MKKISKLTGLILAFLFIAGMTGNVSAATIATLSWTAPTTNSDGSPLTDLKGYKVYYGEAPVASGSCPSGYPVANKIDVPSTSTSYTFNNLVAGKKYYFQVTAYDTSGNESVCSTDPGEVNKLISFSSDFDLDYAVNIKDYSVFIQNFGKTGDMMVGDVDRDGSVSIKDYSIFISDFGKSFSI